jgi:hypothetical protein
MKRQGGSAVDNVSGLVEDAENLVKLQIALAKQEVSEVVSKRNLMAIGMLAGGALFALLWLLIVVPVFLITVFANHVLVALIWLVLYLLIAVVLLLVGKSSLKIKLPPRTVKSAMETKDWILQQLRQIKSPVR